MTTKTDNIACPTCQKTGTWTSDNSFKPFCSYRCKLIDLGEWAEGNHKIPGDPVDIPTQEDDDEE
jgi:endogenous inhibitor of DNA gyrase (YacG/DUF329 family)